VAEVRTRFAPAPSGDLHVGNIRTGLFSWAVARQAGGKFVYRIEDTDASRATDEAFHAAVDILRWLGLDWDEGPVVGGPAAPYRQSERFEVYAGVVAQLQESGHAYPCYCTPEEITARKASRGDKTPGYDGFCRSRTDVPEGVAATMRFRMPDGSTTWDDLVRGEITIEHKDVPDFTILRSNGHPLYMLAATVDDVLMGMTHIVRGEDLLAATPRQMAMYAAMGVPRESFPRFAHLPLIVGEDSKPLSKRNGEVSIAWYRRNGFLPEAMINYLALLGWSPGDDTEVFDVAELVAAFDLARVSKNPARFDVKKLEAINGEHIRRITEGDLAARIVPVLQDAGVLPDEPSADQHELLRAAIPLVQTRLARLTEAPLLLGFLFAGDGFQVDGEAAAKALVGEVLPLLDAARTALVGVSSWTHDEIEAALRAALVDGLGLKPKHAFGPLRVAVTGRTVSPPLFESMELLGRDVTLHRVDAAIADVRGGG
jgi:glutamyl-tRNA synthetase